MILRLALIFSLVCSIASAQWTVTNLTANSADSMSLTFEYLGSATSDLDQSTYTFSGQSLGTADANRYIVLVEGARADAGGTASTSFTVGGVSAASVVTQNPNGVNRVSIRIAQVPTGTTGDVVCTYAEGMSRCAIALYRLVGTPTTHDTGSSAATNPTDTINVAAGGVLIGAGYENTTGSATWTGLTERADAVVQANTFTTAGDGSMSDETGRVITIDFTGTSVPIGAFASFAP